MLPPPPPPQADLVLTQTDTPDPATVGEPLIYSLTVTNNGPASATGVQVADNLPRDVVLDGPVTSSRGPCSGTDPVVCDLGPLVTGASATVTIKVLPTTAGAIGNLASVIGGQFDPNPGNNSSSTATTVNLRLSCPRRRAGAVDGRAWFSSSAIGVRPPAITPLPCSRASHPAA